MQRLAMERKGRPVLAPVTRREQLVQAELDATFPPMTRGDLARLLRVHQATLSRTLRSPHPQRRTVERVRRFLEDRGVRVALEDLLG